MPLVVAKLQGGRQKPTAIILRPTHNRSFDGAALAIAQRWHQAPSFWSAGHYTVDELKRYRCVYDDVVAGVGDDIDKNAIRIAVCAEPANTAQFWDEDLHGRVLRKTAELVAELSLVHNISVDYLNEEYGDKSYAKWQKRRTRRRGGIHVVETSGFPFKAFIDEVNAKRDLKKHI
jgi:hypothetical protein